MTQPVMYVELTSPNAQLPEQKSGLAAGFDLFAAESMRLMPGYRGLISTGLKIALPTGHYGRIAPRSGLALKHGIDTMAGVIDADYRGKLGVMLINHGTEPFEVFYGDRIAQLIIEQISIPKMELVNALGETARGAGGFGSTGV